MNLPGGTIQTTEGCRMRGRRMVMRMLRRMPNGLSGEDNPKHEKQGD
jgi:hypothetical protein